MGQARPDAGDALRPAAGRLLRRAVQAAQPGPAVPVRAGPRDRRAGARRPARRGLPIVRDRVVRRRVDRPGPSRGPALGRGRRGQGPAPGHPGAPPGRHRPDVRACPGSSTGRTLFGDDAEPRASSTSSLAGRPTSSTTSSRRARPCVLGENASGDRLEKIARVYRDYTTSRVLTTELIEGIPLIEIMSAVREGNDGYLEALAERGYDLDRIVRHLDWNMLNQVYVFGYFHADLHPANLFVLPGNAIGYVDFGIVGQLPDGSVDSLTRYSWLLFRGDIEAAVRELMRWLAPTEHDRRGRRPPRARPRPRGVPLRHRADRGGATRRRPTRRRRRQPVLEAGGRHHADRSGSTQLTLSPEPRGLPEDARHARHAAPRAGDRLRPRRHVRRFFRRLVRQQAIAALDPRLAIGPGLRRSVRRQPGDRVRRVPRGPAAGDHDRGQTRCSGSAAGSGAPGGG